ncbi:hypothetical protein FRC17_004323 [Serendipita sp. 399]|nr:hypothetical protein FRC17_004323 [Serendipita sp. 399]
MNSSRNGCLGLPIEIIACIIIQAAGEWPSACDRTHENYGQAPAVTDLDVAEECQQIWRDVHLRSTLLVRVCRLWHTLITPHRFEILLAASSDRRLYSTLIDLYPQYKTKRNLVKRLIIDARIRMKIPVVEVVSTLCRFLNELPRRHIDHTLTHLTITGNSSEHIPWKSIIGHIGKMQALQTIGLGDLPLMISTVPAPRIIPILPHLSTLDIQFSDSVGHDDTALVPTLETLTTALNLPVLRRIRLRDLPMPLNAQSIHMNLSFFHSTLTFIDVQVGITLLPPSPFLQRLNTPNTTESFPALTHFDISLPLDTTDLRDVLVCTDPETLAINYVNRLWEWIEVDEDGIILPMVPYAEVDFDDLFGDVFKAVHDVRKRKDVESSLKTIIIGDMQPSLRMPIRADSYWTALSGIFEHWTAQFRLLGITVLARRSRNQPLQSLSDSLSDIIAQEKSRNSTLGSSEHLDAVEEDD